MKLSIFTHPEEMAGLESLVNNLARSRQEAWETIFYESYDDFITGLSQDDSHCIMVMRNGTDGRESARAAKLLRPQVPLIWFSDDHHFGPESYRVGCAYFAAMPITPEIIEKAFHRCRGKMEQPSVS